MVDLKSVRLSVLEGAERERFLAAHNAARAAVGVEPVKWSDKLAQAAREALESQQRRLIDAAKEGWSERRLALPEHSADTLYGENVAAWAGGQSQSAEQAVAMWLREKPAFDKLNASGSYRVGDEQGQTETDEAGQERPVIVGHYTAVVWKATTHLGAARLVFELADERGNARTYVVLIANYSPPGNRRGARPY